MKGKKTMKKKFPGTVFLRWEGDPPYLIGSPSLVETVDSEDGKTLGYYRLQKVVETKKTTQYRPEGTKEWADAE